MKWESEYLWCGLTVVADPGDPLEILRHGYHSEIKAARRISLTARTDEVNSPDAPFRLEIDGVDTLFFSDPLTRAESAYGHVHNALMDEARERGWVRLHAALLQINGRTLIVTGPSGAGKTGITIRAAQHGAAAHSDEGVFLKAGRVLGLPRRLHVKDSARPSLGTELLADALRLDYPEPIWAVDPGDHWALPPLRPVPVDSVLMLGDASADSRVLPVSDWEAVRALSEESANYSGDLSLMIGELTSLVAQSSCYLIDGYHGRVGAEMLYDME